MEDTYIDASSWKDNEQQSDDSYDNHAAIPSVAMMQYGCSETELLNREEVRRSIVVHRESNSR